MSISLLAAVLFFTHAHAGGLDDYEPAPDPCPDAALVQPADMTDAMFAKWVSVRAMTCGPVFDAPRAFFDRKTGEQLTDDEILRRIFNSPTPVPLPAGVWLLLGALAVLFFSGRPVEQDGGPREPNHGRGGFVP